MFLAKSLVQQYQQTHQRKYGEAISAKEAEQKISNLSELVRIINRNRRTKHGK